MRRRRNGGPVSRHRFCFVWSGSVVFSNVSLPLLSSLRRRPIWRRAEPPAARARVFACVRVLWRGSAAGRRRLFFSWISPSSTNPQVRPPNGRKPVDLWAIGVLRACALFAASVTRFRFYCFFFLVVPQGLYLPWSFGGLWGGRTLQGRVLIAPLARLYEADFRPFGAYAPFRTVPLLVVTVRTDCLGQCFSGTLSFVQFDLFITEVVSYEAPIYFPESFAVKLQAQRRHSREESSRDADARRNSSLGQGALLLPAKGV